MYIVTNRNGLSKSAILTMEKKKLSFPINDVKMVQKKFLLLNHLVKKNEG